MEVYDLINKMDEIINDGKTIPFTNNVIVNRDEINNIIHEIRLKLPLVNRQ